MEGNCFCVVDATFSDPPPPYLLHTYAQSPTSGTKQGIIVCANQPPSHDQDLVVNLTNLAAHEFPTFR